MTDNHNLYGLFGIEDNIQSHYNNQELNVHEEIPIDPNSTKCCICNKDFKYRCPGCELKTCSLVCCKKHKVKYNCSGIRDKTKYVRLADFDQTKFISDFTFLEDVNRIVDGSKRERHKIDKLCKTKNKFKYKSFYQNKRSKTNNTWHNKWKRKKLNRQQNKFQNKTNKQECK